MAISNSKRNFIFGRVSARQPVRPPWSVSEADFIEICSRCGECAKQCPVNIIHIADGGFPEVNFSTSGCDFCAVCVDVCVPGALRRSESAAFNLVANISAECFSERGVICRSCAEVCDIRAIRFKQIVGGIAHVTMDTDLCNGCGECVSICPASAITIEHREALIDPC